MRNSTVNTVTIEGPNGHAATISMKGQEIVVSSSLPLPALVELLTDAFWIVSYAQLKAAYNAATSN